MKWGKPAQDRILLARHGLVGSLPRVLVAAISYWRVKGGGAGWVKGGGAGWVRGQPLHILSKSLDSDKVKNQMLSFK